jgi:N-acyl-D-amino-acid deacylase
MSHDLIISGGTVIDGTGAPAVRADVAVDAGRISRIGDLTGAAAAKTIDASGKLVTPGFVDLHTHLDAQIGWDPQLRSSSYHGVTTALIGNCGVTFAPVAAHNRAHLAKLMEAVEDISADAIMDGLPWNWTSYGGYLDAPGAERRRSRRPLVDPLRGDGR